MNVLQIMNNKLIQYNTYAKYKGRRILFVTSFSFHFANLELFTMYIPPDDIVHEQNAVINRNRLISDDICQRSELLFFVYTCSSGESIKNQFLQILKQLHVIELLLKENYEPSQHRYIYIYITLYFPVLKNTWLQVSLLSTFPTK